MIIHSIEQSDRSRLSEIQLTFIHTPPPKHIHDTQESSRNPEFYNARYFLYVEDLETAKLRITVKDKVKSVGGWSVDGLLIMWVCVFWSVQRVERPINHACVCVCVPSNRVKS